MLETWITGSLGVFGSLAVLGLIKGSLMRLAEKYAQE